MKRIKKTIFAFSSLILLSAMLSCGVAFNADSTGVIISPPPTYYYNPYPYYYFWYGPGWYGHYGHGGHRGHH